MTTITQTPSTEHAHDVFDAMCAGVEDFEQLPAVVPVSPQANPVTEREDEESTGPIDGLILAGLVSP